MPSSAKATVIPLMPGQAASTPIHMRACQFDIYSIVHPRGAAILEAKSEVLATSVPSPRLAQQVEVAATDMVRTMAVVPAPGEVYRVGWIYPLFARKKSALQRRAAFEDEVDYTVPAMTWRNYPHLEYQQLDEPGDLERFLGLEDCRAAFAQVRSEHLPGSRRVSGGALVAVHPELVSFWERTKGNLENATDAAFDWLNENTRMKLRHREISTYYQRCFG